MRGYISKDLHSEISEYSSLLRALRTSSTLDVVSHLTRAQPAATTSRLPKEAKSKRKSTRDVSVQALQGTHLDKGKVRDTWTRWPLPAEDVYVPEWGLDDEVKLLASQSLKIHRSSQASRTDVERSNVHDDPTFDGEQEGDNLPPSFLDTLTLASSAYLSQVLALLVSHVPLSEKSMQNRISPVGWESVLDIVRASEICNEKAVENVQRRMEAIYGPCKHRVHPNIDLRACSRTKFDNICTPEEMDFLTFPPCPTKQ